jgi:PAS domain-containing protein
MKLDEMIASAAALGTDLRYQSDPNKHIVERQRMWRSRRSEYDFPRNDGRWIKAISRRTPMGQIVSARVDVTAIKNAEAEADYARTLLHDAIQAAPVGFTIYDENENLILENSEMRKMRGGKRLRRGTNFAERMKELARQGHEPRFDGDPEAFVADRLARFRRERDDTVWLRTDGRYIRTITQRTPNGVPAIEDSQLHRLLWTRDRAGRMQITIDDTVIMRVTDRSFRDPFRGFAVVNRGGDYAIRNMWIKVP